MYLYHVQKVLSYRQLIPVWEERVSKKGEIGYVR